MVDTIRAAICHGASNFRNLSGFDRSTIEANNAGNPAHDFTVDWLDV